MESEEEYISVLRKKGFTEDFTLGASFEIHLNALKSYKPHQIKIAGFYQCAKQQGTDDSSVLFAIETIDGKKGILVNKPDPGGTDQVSKFIHTVTHSGKKRKSKNFFL